MAYSTPLILEHMTTCNVFETTSSELAISLPAARLMDAAATLFSRHGFIATSVRAITTEAAVSNPMLYYYFGSKEGLFEALLERAVDLSRAL